MFLIDTNKAFTYSPVTQVNGFRRTIEKPRRMKQIYHYLPPQVRFSILRRYEKRFHFTLCRIAEPLEDTSLSFFLSLLSIMSYVHKNN